MQLLRMAIRISHILAIASTLLIQANTSAASPAFVLGEGQGELQSPIASSIQDPVLGFNVILPPLPSCLSSVILVIYVQSLEMLNHRDMYEDMYGPFVRGIEFYVDGTWCDPQETDTGGLPCYGQPLNRSTLPDWVNVVDKNGGGWMMQKSFIHATSVSREAGEHVGYLFMTDDVLLNIGQLSRSVNESGCDVIWRSATTECEDVLDDSLDDPNNREHARVMVRFRYEAHDFYQRSDEQFRTRLTQNMGSPSKYCLGTQNDFLYVPTSMAADWARVAQTMTDVGLVFTFALYTAIFGIARMEDMVVLRSEYLDSGHRSTSLLGDAKFEGGHQPFCWKGGEDVSRLLAMHIIHPNKLSSSTAWNFAQTLNPPGSHFSLSSRADGGTVRGYGGGKREPSAFWCET